MINRRSFLKSTAASLPFATLPAMAAPLSAEPAATSASLPLLAELPQRQPTSQTAGQPWQARVRRVGQTNMTEHDPAVMDVEAWADFWHQAGADVVFISVTGILAYYPSKVPFHRHGRFLNGQDFFGKCAEAARKRGMRIVARMSPDLNWPDALTAHPEWAMRNRDGSVEHNGEDPRLFRTCMFSTYMDDYVPAIMREVNDLYQPDCFYTNGWPPLGSMPECYCSVCSKLPPSGTPAYWHAFNERFFDLWSRYDAIARERKPDGFYFANLGGNVHAGPNLARLGKVAAWFQGDNQGRTNDDPAAWGATLQGRVCNAIRNGSFATNINAAYSTGLVRWRNASKNPAESLLWMSETLAAGLVPYDHFIGAESGLGEDHRWMSVGEEFFRWTQRHDAHLHNRRTLANVGVVIGQSTQVLYKGPATATGNSYMRETVHGLYELLLTGRFAFDFVHEDRLDLDQLRSYRVLILANIALLTSQQCQQLRDYVAAGGSLLASFETGLYDGDLQRRADSPLADLFGTAVAGDAIGTNGNACYARIERQHPVLQGFRDTHWLPGAQNRIPLRPIAEPVLTIVPGFVQYPPELAYPDPATAHTNQPALALQDHGRARCAYFAGDIERTYWLTGHGDLQRLYHNTLRWLTEDEAFVSVQGDGLLEFFAWETELGYSLHMLNYTNPNAFHGWMQATYPLGAQQIAMRLPAGVRATAVKLLRAETEVTFHQQDQLLQFTVPGLQQYEVASIVIA
ncbi:MAG: beta-galactosidase trimerization domain-containing protein [Acidobacteriota bacterium]|nr:beta-galactosidase trimerization domain-containing protein [Acidobacteriota bacterium]